MYNETRNYKKLKEIYNASNNVRSAIPHPRIMGVIKECGGKMWMGERELIGFSLVSWRYIRATKQVIGLVPLRISLIRSRTTMKLVLLNGYKS